MFETIIPQLNRGEKVGIFAHQSPDGDAMGSAYSLKLVLQSMGKEAEVFLLPNHDAMAYPLIKGKEPTGLCVGDCDLLVAVDCADARRLGDYQEIFTAHQNTVAIDHHITHQPFAKQRVVADISSTCELMTVLYEEMGVPVTKDVAINLYTGIVCDTGNFKYSSVTPDTMHRAAHLIEKGIDFAGISKAVFNTKPRAYYGLMRKALDRLQFYMDGKVCVLWLSQQDFEEAEIDESMATGIVTLPTGIEGVEVGVYIRKRSEDEFKISLRSNRIVDVAEIAMVFGGGGHIRAAGYSAFHEDVETVISRVWEEIEKRLGAE